MRLAGIAGPTSRELPGIVDISFSSFSPLVVVELVVVKPVPPFSFVVTIFPTSKYLSVPP
jgi:hypothetical protein